MPGNEVWEHADFYRLTVKPRIQHKFDHFVKPGNVLSHFQSRMEETGVLTERDINSVKAITTHAGDMEGASRLLDCLCCYENWFPLLIDILRLEEVKLGHVAKAFLDLRNKAYDDYLNKTVQHVPPATNNAQQHQQACQPGTERPMGRDFDLDDDQGVSEEDEMEIEADMPQFEPSDPASQGATSSECCSGVDDSGEGYDQLPTANSEDSSAHYDTIDDGDNQSTASAQKSERQESIEKKQCKDFTFEETKAALGELAGWADVQTDKIVVQTFSKINADGHYLVWYWEKKKRPAVCVHYKGKLITFVVHRRPSTTTSTKFMYYIDKKTKSPSLFKLVKYHLDNGVVNLKEPATREMIALVEPIVSLPTKE